MINVYDLHSHFLPSIDDGAKSVSMSLEMLFDAKSQNVELVAATPHCLSHSKHDIDAFLEAREASYNSLLRAFAEKNAKDLPKIVLGAEVYLGCDISEFSNFDALCYSNTEYILLEMANDCAPSRLAEWVYNVISKGIKPIIAHIDRYSFYKELMFELSEMEVVYQVNASNFYNISGRMRLRSIFSRCDKFFVSSDMHNITTRKCNMAMAKEIADRKFSSISNMLFESGGKSIIENRHIECLA